MDKSSTSNELSSILTLVLRVTPALLVEENFTRALTGKLFHLSARTLTYFYLEVMERFNIDITDQYVLDYRFNTLDGIANCVCDLTKNTD